MAIVEISADTEVQISAEIDDTTWLVKEGVTISVDDDAIDSSADGQNRIFIVDGHIYASGGYGITLGISSSSNLNEVIINKTGSIYSDFYGIGTYGDHFRFVNHGTVSGGTLALSVRGDDAYVVNDGEMNGNDGIGIQLMGDDGVVINNGTVTGATSFFTFAFDGGQFTLRNTGTAVGSEYSFVGGLGDETVINTGTMQGDIEFREGDDTFDNRGGTFSGQVTGNDGDDTFIVDTADIDIVELVGEGDDTVRSSVSFELADYVETLILTGFANLAGYGSDTTNVLIGNIGDNALYGFGGSDTFVGGLGKDVFNGGTGIDTADYSEADAAVTVDLAKGKISGSADAAGDRLISIERVEASEFKDRMIGNNAANTLLGGGGNDRLDGGRGNDSLSGEKGKDMFVFSTGYGKDTITDFGTGSSNSDRIDLSDLAGINSFADLKSHHMTNHNGDVRITVGNDVLTIEGYSVSQFVAGDFLL